MDHQKIHSILAQIRELTTQVEHELSRAETGVPSGTPLHYDPLTDPLPWTPAVKGNRRGQDLCLVTALGSVYALNVRERRGATLQEARTAAVKAGYQDARGISNWRGTAIEVDAAGQSWLTEQGFRDFLIAPATRQQLLLPEDLAFWTGGLSNSDRHPA